MSQMLMELEVQTQTEPPFMDDTHGGAFGTGDGAGLEMVRRIPTGYCFNRYDLDTGWFNTIIGEDMDDGKTEINDTPTYLYMNKITDLISPFHDLFGGNRNHCQ